ncbi:ESCRT-II complex vps25 subunit [Russula brevipes]|nr:ESCRT-II complex vps25 subunit [Russula brevipes]
MGFSTHKTPAVCFLLPSIHAAPPFFTEPTTQAMFTEHWTRLLLTYARHQHLFILRAGSSVSSISSSGSEWDEVLRNPRINRGFIHLHLPVFPNLALYEPPTQTRAALLYWRLPEEWAEVLHEWATRTGQLNTILTFYEISDPPVLSPLSGIPESLLRSAIAILAKGGRAQLISISDGDGVRFFPRSAK